MSDSHGESASQGQDTPHKAGEGYKSSPRRLLIISVVMLGFAALTWGPSLFQRNYAEAFIPAWVTLTIATVVISMWFAKKLMEAERYRDSETAPQGAPAHSH